MAVYGYSKRVVNEEYGLHEMSEVTFEVPLADLRRIAAFLAETADRMESGEWRSDHYHLTGFDREWVHEHPNSDVIVVHPAPAQPKRAV